MNKQIQFFALFFWIITLPFHCSPTSQITTPASARLMELSNGNAVVEPTGIAMSQPQPSFVQKPLNEKPIYKRGWFWGVIGGVVGAGVGIGLGAYYGTHQPVPPWNGGILIGR